MIPDYTRVTYMKITAQTYPFAVEIIDTPAFARIPFREVAGNILVIQTDVYHNPIQVQTRVSWCSSKTFKRTFKADMKKNPANFTEI